MASPLLAAPLRNDEEDRTTDGTATRPGVDSLTGPSELAALKFHLAALGAFAEQRAQSAADPAAALDASQTSVSLAVLHDALLLLDAEAADRSNSSALVDALDDPSHLALLKLRLAALGARAEERAQSAVDPAAALDASQTSVCLAVLHDALLVLDAEAADLANDPALASYARLAYSACAQRVRQLLAGAGRTAAGRFECGSRLRFDARAILAGPPTYGALKEGLARVRTMLVDASIALSWLRRHLPDIRPLRCADVGTHLQLHVRRPHTARARGPR